MTKSRFKPAHRFMAIAALFGVAVLSGCGSIASKQASMDKLGNSGEAVPAVETQRHFAPISCRNLCGKSLRDDYVVYKPYEFTSFFVNKKNEYTLSPTEGPKFHKFFEDIRFSPHVKSFRDGYFESVVPLASRTPVEQKAYEARVKAAKVALQSANPHYRDFANYHKAQGNPLLLSSENINTIREKKNSNPCASDALSAACVRAKMQVVYVFELGTYQ